MEIDKFMAKREAVYDISGEKRDDLDPSDSEKIISGAEEKEEEKPEEEYNMKKLTVFSASKLTTLFGCSLAFFLKYVRHEKIQEAPKLVFGKAMHYLLDRFYDVNFKSPESFAGFWKRYWFGIVGGEFLKGKAKKELQLDYYPFIGRDETGKRVEKMLAVNRDIRFGEGAEYWMKKLREGGKIFNEAEERAKSVVGEFFNYMRVDRKSTRLNS